MLCIENCGFKKIKYPTFLCDYYGKILNYKYEDGKIVAIRCKECEVNTENTLFKRKVLHEFLIDVKELENKIINSLNKIGKLDKENDYAE